VYVPKIIHSLYTTLIVSNKRTTEDKMIGLNLLYGLWYEYCVLAIFIFALLSWFVLGSSLGFSFDLLLRSQSKKQLLLSSATKPKMKSFIPSKKSLFRLLKLVLTLGSGAVINNTVYSAMSVTSPQAVGQIVSTATTSFVAHNHLVSNQCDCGSIQCDCCNTHR